ATIRLAIGVVAKQSLDSYAEYEQLVGGVDTLFKESSARVQEYAARAYQTASMSANDYMATVTSFSASLLQGLEGDTAMAADIADMAIQDMSDNANKMGSDMTAIQNAYQGFAKQNYTMLDNLKLGYGGTKTEMQRLLADAQKLTGIKYDINNLADVYSAIHAIQVEMDIYGTTAREASTTIQGSLAATKAAWQNLLVGFADDSADIGTLVSNLVTSGTTALNNILPRISKIFGGISEFIAQAMPVIAAELPAMLEALLPGLVEGAVGLINGLLIALPDILAIILEQIPFIVTQLAQGIVAAFPALLETVKLLFSQIWQWIAGGLLGLEGDFGSSFVNIEELFSSLWQWLRTVWETVGQPIWSAIQYAVGFARDLFAQYMPMIRDFVSSCFGDIRNFWEQNLKPCFDAIGNFIETVLAPIFKTVFETRIKSTIETVFNHIKNIWEGTLKPVFTGITDFLTGVFTGNWEQAWEGIKSIFSGILNGIITGAETMVNSVINGINSLIEAINDLSVVEAISEALGVDGIPTIPTVSLP
ncbi:phage tail protein, partial [Anaerotignum sp.]